MVKRSILFPGGGLSLSEMGDLATQFEEVGYHGLYCVEAYRSGFVPLTVLAGATSSCVVGTYILNARAHPPIAAAMAARDVHDVSGGRVVLGVGSGNPHINEHHLGASNQHSLARMTEYVGGLSRAVNASGDEVIQFEYDGRPITWCPTIPTVSSHVPVYLAAMYPKMRRVAGSVADGVALGSLHSADYVRSVVKPAINEALEAADRDPSSFQFVASALTAVRADGEEARRLARLGLCRLFTPLPHPYYEFALREQGWSAMVDQIAAAMRDDDIEKAAAHVSDEAVDALLVAGDTAQCERVIEKFDGVLDEIILTDATAVGASIAPGTRGAAEGMKALLDLGPNVAGTLTI